MTGDWLDRSARAADERVTRRHALRLAGAGVVALGPLGALLRAAPAYAEPYCQGPCQRALDAPTNRTAAYCALRIVAALTPIDIAYALGCSYGLAWSWAGASAKCDEPYCGDPARYPPGKPANPPPPPAPTSSPAPPPPPPTPTEPPKKKPPKKKPPKKKPPDKKPPDPCGTCAYYCSPCASTKTGYICCLYPPKAGGSPCCP